MAEFPAVEQKSAADDQPESATLVVAESALQTPEADESLASSAKPLIEQLEEALGGRRVIVYYAEHAAMGRWDHEPLYKLLHELGHQKEAAVVIQSTGGSADTAHLMLHLFREYVDDLHVYVPTHAASAATLFCLGADKLWMGPSSELSPIDPQVPVDPRMLIPVADPVQLPFDVDELVPMPAHVIRDFLELAGIIESPWDRPRVHLDRLAAVVKPPLNPWILGWYERADKVARIYGRAALVDYLLKDEADAEARAERIVHHLLYGYASHEVGILRSEARRIGVPVHDCPDDIWGFLEQLRDFYDRVLREQNVGRVLETSDGFHAIPANPRRACVGCGEVMDAGPDYLYCPACGTPFKEECRSCRGALRAGWKFCPRCGTEVSQLLPRVAAAPDPGGVNVSS